MQNKTNSNNINLFDLLELLVNFQDEKFDQKSKALLISLYAYANIMAKKQNKTKLTPYPALLQRLTSLSASSISRAKKNLANLKLIKVQTKYVKQSSSLLRFLKEKRKRMKLQTFYSLQELGNLPLSLMAQNNTYSSQLIAAFKNKQKPVNSSAAYYFLHNYYKNFGLDSKLSTTELVLITALVALCDAQGWTRPYTIDLNSILNVASISRAQFFLSKKILAKHGLVRLISTGKGRYSVYLSDDVINDKNHILKFGMDLQTVDNLNSLLLQKESQSSTENTISGKSNSLNDVFNVSNIGLSNTNVDFLPQSKGERSFNEGIYINKGLIDQQNNISQIDLQAEIKRADELERRRERYITNKIKTNLQRLFVPKKYWTVFTRTILVKINRRLNKLGYHLHILLEKGDYMGILPLQKKYRINDYNAYIQSILTQWKCIGFNAALELLEL